MKYGLTKDAKYVDHSITNFSQFQNKAKQQLVQTRSLDHHSLTPLHFEKDL